MPLGMNWNVERGQGRGELEGDDLRLLVEPEDDSGD